MRQWARGDVIDSVDYATQIGARILDYYDDYFGIEFPLPKLGMCIELVKHSPFVCKNGFQIRPAMMYFILILIVEFS